MVRAKNYETTSTFVEVMQKKTVAFFFRTRCMIGYWLKGTRCSQLRGKNLS